MEDRFNPFGLLILVAFGGAAFNAINEAADKHGMALYWPSFAPPAADYPIEASSNASVLPVPTPPPFPPGSALPPPPGAIGQGGPAAPPPGVPAAPPAAPPPAAAGEEVWQVDRAGLQSLLNASGGLGDDGCLKTPVIVDGLQGLSRVEAAPTWQPGAMLIFSIEPTQGAVQCLEFAFDRSSPQW